MNVLDGQREGTDLIYQQKSIQQQECIKKLLELLEKKDAEIEKLNTEKARLTREKVRIERESKGEKPPVKKQTRSRGNIIGNRRR